ncbi:MAG: CHASE domain-containing protein, partial [Spirochaetes bacterium]|nr:CHASE domain-containing protein [Spirochaetota bacterium]
MQTDTLRAQDRCSPRRTLSIIAGTATCLGITALFVVAGVSYSAMLSQYERGEVLLEASSVRMAVEGHLNERISLERGVVALMTTNPGLDEPGYAAFASALVGNDSCVKNLAVLEGTTVKFVYPFEPNKAAVGKDLSAIPEQAESVRRAKETREPIVSGPIPLVQGGAGIVSRMGIFPAGP